MTLARQVSAYALVLSAIPLYGGCGVDDDDAPTASADDEVIAASGFINCGNGKTVHGAIGDKFLKLGGCASQLLGEPITNESGTPDGIGRFNHFQKHASIYWTPATGPWSVHGSIRDKWAQLGWERSALGYPISDEFATYNDGGVPTGRESSFELGSIHWDGRTASVHNYASTSCQYNASSRSGTCAWTFHTPTNFGWYTIPEARPEITLFGDDHSTSWLGPSPGWVVNERLSYAYYKKALPPSGFTGPACIESITVCATPTTPTNGAVNQLIGLQPYVEFPGGNAGPVLARETTTIGAREQGGWCFHATFPETGRGAICPTRWVRGSLVGPARPLVVATDDYVDDSRGHPYGQINREIVRLQ